MTWFVGPLLLVRRSLSAREAALWPPIIASRWAAVPCGAPDVPHTQTTSHKDIRATPFDPPGDVEEQQSLAGGGGAASGKNDEKENNSQSAAVVRISFRVRDSAQQWDASLYGSQLVLPIPVEGLPEGSKEAITELLEYAEEQIRASEVIVSINKERADRATIIRTLMYLGFESLGPRNSVVPIEVQDPQLYFMTYQI